jgi:hypothetical protein
MLRGAMTPIVLDVRFTECGREAPPEVVRQFTGRTEGLAPGGAAEACENRPGETAETRIWMLRAGGGRWGPADRYACPMHRRTLL